MHKPTPEHPYPADQFLRDLNHEWHGQLYFGINPVYQPHLVDIRPKLMIGLIVLAQMTNHSKPLETIAISANPARDFRGIAVARMPHSGEARDRVHILADPFCRGFLSEQLDWMMNACLDTKAPRQEGEFVTEDRLPFKLEGPDSEVFKSPFTLPNLDAYFARVKHKADILGKILDLTPDEAPRFVEQVHLGMDRASQYVRLCQARKDESLHPIVQVITRIMLLQYQQRPQGPSLLM